MKRSFLTKFRKVLALAILLLLLVSFAGCRKKDDSGSTEGNQDPIPTASTGAVTQAPPETTVPPTTEAPTTAPTEETTEPTTEATTPATEPASAQKGTITASELRIRKQPGTQYPIVGSYIKGTKVEILETKGEWGRTDKGWIKLEHVSLGSDFTDEEEEDEIVIESNGNTKVKGYGVVTTDSLNVRSGPGTKYEDIDDVELAERYAYYEKDGNWVRIKNGWVSLTYFYLEGTTGTGAGTGTVIDADLNIRSGPGKDYEWVGGIKKGETVKILAQVKNWGYTEDGWVSMSYVKMDYTASAEKAGTITASSLNIRKEANEESEKLGSYVKGDKVQILEIQGDWGRTDQGWISMEHVKLDEPANKNKTGIVTASTLFIRKEPNKEAEDVGYYEKGDEIEILETKDDWYRTNKGWVNKEYVGIID